MAKFLHSWLIMILCVISIVAFSACSLTQYKSQDIQDLYETTKENQFNEVTGINEMFGNGHAISITYDRIIQKVSVDANSTVNAYNLYAIDKVYNRLFDAIFQYYENWNENFFESADKKLSSDDFNQLYNALNMLNEELFKVASVKEVMETSVINHGVEDVSTFNITTYIYQLNSLVEKSLDFVNCFRSLHVNKLFTDSTVSANTIARTMDDMLLSLAQLIYIDNIQPFAIKTGGNAVCDISMLVNAYINNNEYVILNYLDRLDVPLKQSVIDAIDIDNNVETMKKADKYLYYSNILRQKILTLGEIESNIDYYKLSLYRFGKIEGGVEVYRNSVSDLENTSYNFLCQTQDFITNYYFNAFEDLNA